MLCKQCGQPIEDGKQFCSSCGTPVSGAAPQSAGPEHYSNGALIAWSVISLLLCLIPGIVALVQACGINGVPTAELQQKKISSCKIWCLVSTILGALQVISLVISYFTL